MTNHDFLNVKIRSYEAQTLPVIALDLLSAAFFPLKLKQLKVSIYFA